LSQKVRKRFNKFENRTKTTGNSCFDALLQQVTLAENASANYLQLILKPFSLFIITLRRQ